MLHYLRKHKEYALLVGLILVSAAAVVHYKFASVFDSIADSTDDILAVPISSISYSCDFGISEQNAVLTTQFYVRNSTPEAIKLVNIQKSCSCVHDDNLPGTLAPGESRDFSLSIKTGDAEGAVRQQMILTYSGGNTNYTFMYTLLAQVRPTLSVSPREIVFTTDLNTPFVPFKIDVVPYTRQAVDEVVLQSVPDQLKLLANSVVKAPGEGQNGLPDSPTKIRQGGTYTFEFAPNVSRESVGSHFGSIKVVAMPQNVAINVPYRIVVTSDYAVIPSNVTVTKVDGKYERDMIVRYIGKGKEDFASLSVATEPPGLIESHQLSENNQKLHKLKVVFRAPPKSPLTGRMIVTDRNGGYGAATVVLE